MGLALPAQGRVTAGSPSHHERRMLSPADRFQRFPFALAGSEFGAGGVFAVRGQSLKSRCVTGVLAAPCMSPTTASGTAVQGRAWPGAASPCSHCSGSKQPRQSPYKERP